VGNIKPIKEIDMSYKDYSCYLNISNKDDPDFIVGDRVIRDPIKYKNIKGSELLTNQVGIIVEQIGKSHLLIQWEGEQDSFPIHKDNLKITA
jgi:hypothetical protein